MFQDLDRNRADSFSGTELTVFVTTGAEVGREEANADSARSKRVIGAGYGRVFVAAGADAGVEEAEVD